MTIFCLSTCFLPPADSSRNDSRNKSVLTKQKKTYFSNYSYRFLFLIGFASFIFGPWKKRHHTVVFKRSTLRTQNWPKQLSIWSEIFRCEYTEQWRTLLSFSNQKIQFFPFPLLFFSSEWKREKLRKKIKKSSPTLRLLPWNSNFLTFLIALWKQLIVFVGVVAVVDRKKFDKPHPTVSRKPVDD